MWLYSKIFYKIKLSFLVKENIFSNLKILEGFKAKKCQLAVVWSSHWQNY
jgi:hypothetical protein